MFGGGGRGNLANIGGEGPGGLSGNNQRFTLGSLQRTTGGPRTGSHVVGQPKGANPATRAQGVSGGGRYAATGSGTPQDLFNRENQTRNTNPADPRNALRERYAEGAAQGSYGLGSAISNGLFLPAWEAGKALTQGVPGMAGIVNPVLRGLTGTSPNDPSTDPGIVAGQSSPANINNVWAGWNGLMDGYNHGNNPGFNADPRYASNDSYMQTPQGGEPTNPPPVFGTAGYGGYTGTEAPSSDEYGAVTDPTYFGSDYTPPYMPPTTGGYTPPDAGPGTPGPSQGPGANYSPAGYTPGDSAYNAPLDGYGGPIPGPQYGSTSTGTRGYWYGPHYVPGG